MTEKQDRPEPQPETEMMTKGWDPAQGLGSLKTPLFHTSTFHFESAEAAKRAFDVTYGGEVPEEGEQIGYIYTRLDHPNLVVVEGRLALWDQADRALLFSSGMSAIYTTLLTLLRPGDLILHSSPLYGGTNSLFEKVLAPMGIEAVSFGPDAVEAELDDLVAGRKLGVVYVESPANPTNDIFDIAMAATVARNTGRQPWWTTPIWAPSANSPTPTAPTWWSIRRPSTTGGTAIWWPESCPALTT